MYFYCFTFSIGDVRRRQLCVEVLNLVSSVSGGYLWPLVPIVPDKSSQLCLVQMLPTQSICSHLLPHPYQFQKNKKIYINKSPIVVKMDFHSSNLSVKAKFPSYIRNPTSLKYNQYWSTHEH